MSSGRFFNHNWSCPEVFCYSMLFLKHWSLAVFLVNKIVAYFVYIFLKTFLKTLYISRTQGFPKGGRVCPRRCMFDLHTSLFGLLGVSVVSFSSHTPPQCGWMSHGKCQSLQVSHIRAFDHRWCLLGADRVSVSKCCSLRQHSSSFLQVFGSSFLCWPHSSPAWLSQRPHHRQNLRVNLLSLPLLLLNSTTCILHLWW